MTNKKKSKIRVTKSKSNTSKSPGIQSSRIEERPIPNINIYINAAQKNMQRTTARFMPTPGRKPGTMPTVDELSNLNKTGQRLARAYALSERVSFTVASSEFSEGLKATKECGRAEHSYAYRDSDDHGVQNVAIGALKEWPKYMHCCADVIEAMILTDFRVGVMGATLHRFPKPSCVASVTKLRPLGSKDPMLTYMGAREFVILLADAMMMNMYSKFPTIVLHMVHELFNHAELRFDCLDWSDLQQDPRTAFLTEEFCRFAVASLGIKLSRRIFRSSSSGIERKATPWSDPLSNTFLLDEVDAFSRMQIMARPESPVGYWNLGWVSQQAPSQRGTHGLIAAADSLYWFTKAFKVADEDGDDFISAAARIEAAGCHCVSAAGVVGIKNLDGVVRRDFRSKFSRPEHDPADNDPKSADSWHFEVVMAKDANHGKRIMEHEAQRNAKNTPPTKLSPSEEHLVEWWEPLKLWNEAMKSYDALTKYSHEYCVYGETTLWESVVEMLNLWVEKQKLNLDMMQFAMSSVEPGFPSKRDRGQFHKRCAVCQKAHSTKLCSRCKKTYYCSSECQKKDWKSHKKECRPPYNLQRGYTFWYMRRGRGQKAAESTGDPAADATTTGKDAPTPYESSVKQIATVRTVNEFWTIYNHITRPNDIPNNMTPLDYHFFLEGVKPTWEDEGNAKGGKWIVRLRKGLASRYWEEVILALIGGQLPGVPDGDVCGAVISMRYSEDIVSVWNRRADDRDSTERLRDAIKKVLRLPSNVHMEYKPHQASLMDKSSFRNTTVWKSSKMDRSRSIGERDSDRGNRLPSSLRNRNNSWGEREGNLPAPSPKSRDSSDRWR